MSTWLDRLENVDVEIRTGDSRSYTLLWKNATRSKNYNYTAFNFIGARGTRVDRREAEGYQYDLELYFTGENHLNIAENFEISADDRRAWTITHPFYGSIIVQPLSIQRDDKKYNRTLFRIKVWETIGNQYPVERIVADDAVRQIRSNMGTSAIENYAILTPTLDSETQAVLASTIDDFDEVISEGLPQTGTTFAQFQNRVGDLRNRLTEPLAEASTVLRLMENVITFPIDQISSVQSRINIFRELLGRVTSILLPSVGSAPLQNKRIFEIQGSLIFGSMLNSAITPSSEDYQIRTEVADVSNVLNDEYASLLQSLESAQTERPDQDDAFTPDDNTSRLLYDAFATTQANLFDQAFNARQERIVLLEQDDNAIRLTHRFYSLDSEDENLDFFITSNNLSLDEIINIKRGRRIIYYV